MTIALTCLPKGHIGEERKLVYHIGRGRKVPDPLKSKVDIPLLLHDNEYDIEIYVDKRLPGKEESVQYP